MVIEIMIALFLGVAFGVVTGLFPGIHINLVAAGLLALVDDAVLDNVPILTLAVFVVAMAITHTFIDFIPSVFLGAPEEDSFLAVLPGHQLLREGKGYEAVVLTLFGSLVALPVILIFSLLFVLFLPFVFDFFQAFIPYILIFVSLYLIFLEEEFIISLVAFSLSGFLGLLAFNLPVQEPLLPLLTGLFGVSGLIVSLRNTLVIPQQKIMPLRKVRLGKRRFLTASLSAAIAAPLCSFLPGIGSGHAAVIGSELAGDLGKDKRSFLFLVGAINTIVMALSFVTVYAIGRTRTGAAVAVQKILGEISVSELLLVLSVVTVSGILAFFVGVSLSKLLAQNIVKINYRVLSFMIIGILLLVNFILSNFLGILILATASALGVFTILSRTRRINLMGVLLIPTIVFYLTV